MYTIIWRHCSQLLLKRYQIYCRISVFLYPSSISLFFGSKILYILFPFLEYHRVNFYQRIRFTMKEPSLSRTNYQIARKRLLIKVMVIIPMLSDSEPLIPWTIKINSTNNSNNILAIMCECVRVKLYSLFRKI